MHFIERKNFIDFSAPPVIPNPEPETPTQEEDDGKLDMVMQAVKDLSDKVKKKDQTSALTKAIVGLSSLFKKQVDDNDEIKKLLGQIADRLSMDIPAPVVNVAPPSVSVPAPVVNVPAPIVNLSPTPVTVQKPDLTVILQKLDQLLMAPKDAVPALNDGPVLGKRKAPRLVLETPTGTIDGSNTKFYSTRASKWGTQALLFLNGAYQTPSVDFTFSGNQITYTLAPTSGSNHYILMLQ